MWPQAYDEDRTREVGPVGWVRYVICCVLAGALLTTGVVVTMHVLEVRTSFTPAPPVLPAVTTFGPAGSAALGHLAAGSSR